MCPVNKKQRYKDGAESEWVINNQTMLRAIP